MLKFNNNHIFTGYLKQLLQEFNLPKYRVYTLENKQYNKDALAHNEAFPLDKWPEEKNIIKTIKGAEGVYPKDLRYALYIKDGLIQRYVEDLATHSCFWEPTGLHYHENKHELNQTKNLIIKNNIYDTYTHEYLGDFLRFCRDYYRLDLMPLYNCFSNTICNKLNISGIVNNNPFIFDSEDPAYKIYMLPVKLFNKYTIAIDCDFPVEMCCGIYGTYQDHRTKLANFPIRTYQKFNQLQFNNPVIFDKLVNLLEPSNNPTKLTEPLIDQEQEALEIAQNENNLKLFIKLPANNSSTITVLEGDYTGFNNHTHEFKNIPGIDNRGLIIKANHIITNYATESEKQLGANSERKQFPPVEQRQFKPITTLQLLQLNTGISYPVADRLIEYLSGNTINNLETISDNMLRVNQVLGFVGNYSEFPGVWNDKIRPIMYDYINSPKFNGNLEINHDILGYVDKDIEKYFAAVNPKTNKLTSISNVDIYPDMYKSAKEGSN